VAAGTEWNPRVKEMIGRLKLIGPAEKPFDLAPGSRVIDPVKFHESLVGDALAGPRSPRGRTGSFVKDLENYLAVRGEQWDTKSAKPATDGA
jgi:hypothetical protein